jgi:peptidase E
MEAGNPLMDEYVLGLASGERPRVCFLPSASGDADHYIVRFYRTFAADRCEPSHVSLFRRERGVTDVREHLLSQDLIYVGGGSVVSLLGVWRAHGLDAVLREAWEAGVVLCGLSAGSLCWFAEGVTAFHGPPEPVQGLLAEGMRAGYACEDGTALHFVGEELARVVSSRPKASAYRVQAVEGRVVETPLEIEYLGSADAAPELTDAIAA